MKETFKARMKRLRLRAGLKTHQKAADVIGCTRGNVSMWEAPSSDVKSVGEYLLQVAAAYKVRPAYINSGEGDDGYPWPESTQDSPAGADSNTKTTAAAPQALRRDADILRTAMGITDRAIALANASATDEARAEITLAIYDLIQEGHGMEAAERIVTSMLRAFGGLTTPEA